MGQERGTPGVFMRENNSSPRAQHHFDNTRKRTHARTTRKMSNAQNVMCRAHFISKGLIKNTIMHISSERGQQREYACPWLRELGRARKQASSPNDSICNQRSTRDHLQLNLLEIIYNQIYSPFDRKPFVLKSIFCKLTSFKSYTWNPIFLMVNGLL